MADLPPYLEVGGPIGAALGAIFAGRKLIWKGIVMLAIAIAKEDCQRQLQEMKEEFQGKIDVLIDAIAQASGREVESHREITSKMQAVKAASASVPPKPKRR